MVIFTQSFDIKTKKKKHQPTNQPNKETQKSQKPWDGRVIPPVNINAESFY